jgi:lipoyl(octanoyl) transferase
MVKDKDSIAEYLRILLHRETESYPLCKDYLSNGATPRKGSDPVSEVWRRKLCEWCYEVVDHFSFDREVVSIALNFLDRAAALKSEQTDEPIPKREFQLLAVTCLYIALKIHGETDTTDGPRRKLTIDAFVELSRGFFQIDIIESTERNLLTALKWLVNPPTSLKFVATFIRLCPKWGPAHPSHATNVRSAIYDVARYLTELSVCSSTFTFNHNTSVISFAAILCAIEALPTAMALPWAVQVSFLENVKEATGLAPDDPKVLQVVDMLKDLCPSMFEGDDIPSEFLEDSPGPQGELLQDDGKASPVCVIDGQNGDTRRKRSRQTAEETWRPIHQS